MAEVLDDLEFLLPSELLTDDDLLTDFNTDRIRTRISDDASCGFGNPFGFSSDLSSPVESVTGTMETESDEYDFIAELSRKVSHSTLQDTDFTSKGLKLSTSPQSTLCGFKPGSRGSPKSGSGVCSPPEAKEALDLELLYAAAGEVARLQMIEDTAAFYYAKQLAPLSKPASVPVPPHNPSLAPGFYTNQSQRQTHHSYEQLHAAKFLGMKQHQMMNSRFWDQGIPDYQLQNGKNIGVKSQGIAMSSWPTLQQSHHQQRHQQQPTGSGMRAVFLGDTGSKKERVGTGVFMPRRFCSNPTESRKKLAGCSTVLIPDRVAQVLNLNMDSIEAQVQHSGSGGFTTDYDMGLKHKRNVMVDQQRRNLRPHAVLNQELSLPQEWTY